MKLFSTKELALLIHVNESTIKRWTNDGILHCFKTPGGHRKYRMEDVHEFLKTHDYEASGIPVLSFDAKEQLIIRFSLMEKQFDKLTAVCFKYAIIGNKDRLYELLTYVYQSGISFAEICDEIIRPAMQRIGDLWYDGKLGIDGEHIASHSIMDTLTRLQTIVHKQPEKKSAVVCGVLADDLHELPLLCVRNLLEIYGWKTYYVGANIPLESLAETIKLKKPDLVCISATTKHRTGKIMEAMNRFHQLIKGVNTTVILGGQAFTSGILKQIRYNFCFDRLHDLEELLSQKMK